MAAFEYQALDASGRTRRGLETGESARQVRQQLRLRGLAPLHVQAVSEADGKGIGWRPGARRRLGSLELAVIARQFATLVAAGISVEDSLNALVGQAESFRVRSVLSGVRASVLEGRSLADAVSAYPAAFPEIYRAAIGAGEESGKLALTLEYLAEYSETSQGLRERLGQALIYPLVLLFASLLIVGFLFAYVMPRVARVFTNTNQELPWLTQTFFDVGDFLAGYGYAVAAGMALLVLLVAWLFRQHSVREGWDRLLLRLPLTRRTVRALNTTRMSRTLAIMTRSGVPLLTGLKAAADVVVNLPMRRAVNAAAEEVGEGVSLHRALDRSGLFPPMLIQMVASGETGGVLGEMLDRAATAQEREFEARVGLLTRLFEPMMILVMGAIVFVIVLAILLPIFEMNQLVF
ncbi:MAG: type II secretion system inner membrane protein GspF [Gammaproteobacteria bacterium]|jgi:general secretion pathway protein F|nr:type II secretion system inner membrane protein GspF [Gammaproteobacteria bacterium]